MARKVTVDCLGDASVKLMFVAMMWYNMICRWYAISSHEESSYCGFCKGENAQNRHGFLEAYEESSSPRGYFDNHQLIQLAAQLLSE